MAFDISDLKEHNEKLIELLSEHLPDMLWVKERNGNYIYANQAICDGLLMAKDTSEPIGKNDLFFAERERNAHPENLQWHTFGELCFNSDLIVIENNKPMKFEEFGNVKGEILYLEVYKAPFYDKEGNIIGTVGAGRDITRLKQVQIDLEQSLQNVNLQRKQLESFNSELEKRVQEEIEKQQKQERLMIHQSRQAAMGEMLESIAHQWRQPLNIIGLATANIETLYELNALDADQFSEKIKIITSNIDYMSHTIDDFRKFLQPERGIAIFDPRTSITEVLEILDAQMQCNKIKCCTQNEDELLFYGVENEFKQVIMILINNAIDAIKVQLETQRIEQGTITIVVQKSERDGLIDVIDNGGGVDSDIIDKIFTPYFTTKHESYGTGIGLYIAKNIIEMRMRGTLMTKNVENGSCFRIKIPLMNS